MHRLTIIIMDIAELYRLYLQTGRQATTDSRDCPAGSIFFALKGESFDGNRFAKAALDKGCAYAVVDEAEYADSSDPRFILVDDVLTAFKEMAREHRRQFSIPVIGITGTNGKTTTKELVAAVLSEKYSVMYTQGNFNNDVGVPKTLLRMDACHDIAVVEMGASHPGDIEKLVNYAEPTCGMITNVGRAHLQGFGSFEGVKQTKGELYDFLAAHDGLLFLNSDNEHLVQMAADRNISRAITYGQHTEATVQGEVTGCSPFLAFRFWTNNIAPREISSHLIGAYNIDNMLAAITIGLHFGVTPEQICHALESYIPSNNRSQFEETAHNKLIVDAYNANPSSMMAALQNFSIMDASNKMVILGDMRELGDVSDEEHQKITDFIGTTDIKDVWLVGSEFAKTSCPYRKFKDVEEVKAAISACRPSGCCILIKGSNGTKLFQLPEML